MSSLKASIIINTKDRVSRLNVVLKALENQVSESTEVIVVFDGCTEDSLYLFSRLHFRYPIITVISKKNVGRSAARNLGIKKASGDILIFLDDDRVPCENFVKMHLAAHVKPCVFIGNRRELYLSEDVLLSVMESEEKLMFFLDNMESNLIVSCSSRETLLRKILFFRHNPALWMLFYTGNTSVSRDDIMRSGLFDENFEGWGYEDLDMGYRLFKNGIPFILGDDAYTYHLSHKISVYGLYEDSVRNWKYFYDKIQGDYLAHFVLLLLYAVLHIRITHRYHVFSSAFGGKLRQLAGQDIPAYRISSESGINKPVKLHTHSDD